MKRFAAFSPVPVILAFWCVTAPAFGHQSVLHFNSEPGDFIGRGQQETLTTDEVDFRAERTLDNGVSLSINNISRPDPPRSISWSAKFAPAEGMDLIEGLYENATRWPFQDPTVLGLSFSGNGRGCNTLKGRFEVLEAVYDPTTDAVISFAVDFEQHCEGGDPALFGSIRFNSDVPLPPIPKCDIELDQATYTAGDTVTAASRRLTNPGADDTAVEIKTWFDRPELPPVSILSAGADGSVVLPAGFDQDFGPMALAPVTVDTPLGPHVLNCRLLDPVTGETLSVDINRFEIE